MKELANLLNNIEYRTFGNQIEGIKVTAVTADSRMVRGGTLFVAVAGLTVDGHEFVQDAVDKGCVAVVVQRGLSCSFAGRVCVIEVADSSLILGELAAAFYDYPARRMQMIGIGDGEDEMFYVIWGEDAPNTDPWITTYEGWFPEGQWVTVELPVGQDWHGRFGNYGPIDRIFYVNDSDYLNEPGVIYIDNLRDVSEAQPLAPTASFEWNWGDPVGGDSIEVVYANMSRDDDSGTLSFLWSFGDGKTSTEEHPVHVYPRGGRWPVTLRATDRDHNWDIYSTTVVDSPLTLQSDFTISCVGDIMIGP